LKALTNFLAAFAILTNSQYALAQTINPPKQEISPTGSPFAVSTTPDGRYVFASLSGAANGIAVIKQEHTSATLVRVLAAGGGTYGLIVTPDRRTAMGPLSRRPTPLSYRI
jgi:hypothetical protein